ncbi:hypothetical protein D9M69_512760 [compost metagenome]
MGEGVAAGEHRRVPGHVGKEDGLVAGQGMLRRGDEVQRVVPHRHRLHRQRGFRGQGDHRQLHAAVEDLLVGHLRIEELDIQGHLRVGAGEGAQQRRQAMQADMVAGGEGQAAADVAGQVAQGAAGVVQHIEDLVGAWQQGASGFGQAYFAAEAVEQAHAELLFQGRDALAHRRLGQVQAFAGFGEAAGLGDGDEGVEAGQIHFSELQAASFRLQAGLVRDLCLRLEACNAFLFLNGIL